MAVRRSSSADRAVAALSLLLVLLAASISGGCTGGATEDGVRPDRSPPAPVTSPAERTVAEAPARTPPPKRAGPLADVGDTLTLKGIDSTIEMTVTRVLDPARSTDEFVRPEGRYVGVRLEIRNRGSSVYGDSPSNGAVLIDDRGEAYTADFATITAGQDIGSPRIRPGDARSGWVVFDVPRNAELARFQYTTDSGLGDTMAEWELS